MVHKGVYDFNLKACVNSYNKKGIKIVNLQFLYSFNHAHKII